MPSSPVAGHPQSPARSPARDAPVARNPTPDTADSQPIDSPRRPKSSSHARDLATAFRERTDPLPYDEAPPLPDEAPPEDDGWDYEFDKIQQAYYYWNRFTGKTQWENPRAAQGSDNIRPATTSAVPSTTSSGAPGTSLPRKRLHGGYNPAIHGSYDPNADYARQAEKDAEEEEAAAASAAAVAAGLPDPNAAGDYSTVAHFNRFNGRYQAPGMNPEYHNDENKSRRQLTAYYDVDAAANSHAGRSLREERRNTKLSKGDLKAYRAEKKKKKREKELKKWTQD